MGLMEWLALEVTLTMLHFAPEIAEKIFQCSMTDLCLDVVWKPHKITFNGENMQTGAMGANERADFLLLAKKKNHETFKVLCTIYHTTNVPPETVSGRKEVIVPESCLLGSCEMPVSDILEKAVETVANSHRQRQGFVDMSPLLRDGEAPDEVLQDRDYASDGPD